MRVLLVNVPWAALEVPSLALGILRRRVQAAVPDADVDVLYANLTFADWISERTAFDVPDYNYVAQTSYFVGVGDWIFSSALYDDPAWHEQEFRRHRGHVLSAHRMSQALALHRQIPEFTAALADQIVAARPDVVGFTSTFQQNTAALAVARQVKLRRPETVTVFGGANCDGPQGVALHRAFPFVDYVCRGEGEVSFVMLLNALAATFADGAPGKPPAGDVEGIAGLCWTGPDGATTVNPMAERPLSPMHLVAPDYTDYFHQLGQSKIGSSVEPKLVVEGARGCWWGAKQHCTFCGLNGSSMEFRSKPPAAFLHEVVELVERHQVLDVFVVDNILDMNYLTSFLPMLADADYDLRMQYEIKSNLRHDQLEVLSRAGASTLQPGIENLSSRVLKIMRKGVSGTHNVRLLRDAESLQLSLAWNYLYGFPGETAADYDDIVAQLPALHHLYPPEYSGRIAIERFSPYFEDPSLGFPDPAPDVQYRITYDLGPEDMRDLAYLFDAPRQGITQPVANLVDAAVHEWQQQYTTSRFCYHDHGEAITLVSDRRGFDWSTLRLTDPVEVQAFRVLDQPRTPAGVARAIEIAGERPPEDAVRDLLRRWRALGIVFEEAGRFICLATADGNQDLFHLDCEEQYLGQESML